MYSHQTTHYHQLTNIFFFFLYISIEPLDSFLTYLLFYISYLDLITSFHNSFISYSTFHFHLPKKFRLRIIGLKINQLLFAAET